MAGHSKWKNIRLRKGKQDAVRGVTFTKLAKEIILAAKNGGGNPDTNIQLRTAIDAARKASMPNDNIKRNIGRGTGEVEGANYEELTYEGYGPSGLAVMVLCLTDNKNRTVPDVRSIFSKNGGRMAESGSVGYLFNGQGIIGIEAGSTTEERLMEIALEAGAEDVQPDEEGGFEVTTAPQDLYIVQQALENAKIKYESAEQTLIPTTTVQLAGKDVDQALKLLDLLEDHDDVQKVYSNLELTEEQLADLE